MNRNNDYNNDHNTMREAIMLDLERQKSVLIQQLNYYILTQQESAAIETKQDLDEVEKKLKRIRERR